MKMSLRLMVVTGVLVGWGTAAEPLFISRVHNLTECYAIEVTRRGPATCSDATQGGVSPTPWRVGPSSTSAPVDLLAIPLVLPQEEPIAAPGLDATFFSAPVAGNVGPAALSEEPEWACRTCVGEGPGSPAFCTKHQDSSFQDQGYLEVHIMDSEDSTLHAYAMFTGHWGDAWGTLLVRQLPGGGGWEPAVAKVLDPTFGFLVGSFETARAAEEEQLEITVSLESVEVMSARSAGGRRPSVRLSITASRLAPAC